MKHAVGTASGPRMPGRPQGRTTLARMLVRALLPTLAATAVLAASNEPLQYTDDQTGATITAVNKPLLFAHNRSEMNNGPRDYVTLAAVAVDRSGKYTYLLLAYFWTVGVAQGAGGDPQLCQPLALQLQDGRLELPPESSAHDAGIGVAVHRPPFGSKTPCVYPTDLATLRRIAQTPHPVLYSAGTAASVQYDLFEDRTAALREFVAQLKDGD